MSYNALPESNGLQVSDHAQYFSSNFTYHVDPQLDLKLDHEKVLELQTQEPQARMNIFLVDFLFDVGQPVSVFMVKLTEIRKTLWIHHRGTIFVCSLSYPHAMEFH